MAYTVWSKLYSSSEWTFSGLQIDSEKLAMQAFGFYRLAPGEMAQLRDSEGTVLEERIDETRPHDPAASA